MIEAKVKLRPYEKGDYGKGSLIGDKAITWETDEENGAPHHDKVMETLGLTMGDGHEFHIYPDGSFAIHNKEGEGSSSDAAKKIEEDTGLTWKEESEEEFEKKESSIWWQEKMEDNKKNNDPGENPNGWHDYYAKKKKPKKDDPEYWDKEEVDGEYCYMTIYKGPKEASSPWTTFDPLICPSCGSRLSEPHQMAGTDRWINTCPNCRGTFTVPPNSPLLQEFQQGWQDYPDILKRVNNPNTQWAEILSAKESMWVEAANVDEEVQEKPEDAFPSSSLGQYLKHVDKNIKHKPAPKKSYREIFAEVVLKNWLDTQENLDSLA